MMKVSETVKPRGTVNSIKDFMAMPLLIIMERLQV